MSCKTIERVDIIDGFVRCNRREALEFYNNGCELTITVSDASPITPSYCKYTLTKAHQFSDTTFKCLLEIFEKKFCRNGDWLSLFISIDSLVDL